MYAYAKSYSSPLISYDILRKKVTVAIRFNKSRKISVKNVNFSILNS